MTLINDGDRPVPVTRRQVFWAGWAAVGLVSVGWASLRAPAPAVFFTELGKNWSLITVSLDLLFLGVAAVIFAVFESRRLGMRWPWIWIPLAIPLPGAFLIPFFLLLRERAMIRAGEINLSGL